MTTSANTKLIGLHDDIYGDASGIYGDVSGITGDVSGFVGDATGVVLDLNHIEIVEYLKIVRVLDGLGALCEHIDFDIAWFYRAFNSGIIQKQTKALLNLKERLCASAGW